jgi:hypothetical protein
LDLKAFEHPSVRAAKSALALEERRHSDFKESDKKFPFTVDMVQWVKTQAETRFQHNTMKHMISVAIQLAFFCLLRASEYVPEYKADAKDCAHALKSNDVLFEVNINGSKSFVPSHAVEASMWPHVSLVKFILRSAKNDKMRIGSIFWFKNLSDVEGINIVRSTFEWAVRANLSPLDFFMSFRVAKGSPVVPLRYRMVSHTIKECAVAFKFNRNNFGTHSPRIGGACTLRAGAAPDTMIQLLGRWKTLMSSLGYQESSMEEFDRMQMILQNPNFFTHKDINLIHDKSGRQKSL